MYTLERILIDVFKKSPAGPKNTHFPDMANLESSSSLSKKNVTSTHCTLFRDVSNI